MVVSLEWKEWVRVANKKDIEFSFLSEKNWKL
jgi:hypothetical protein